MDGCNYCYNENSCSTCDNGYYNRSDCKACDESCEICNEESANKNLCIKCNNAKGYYFLNKDSISKEEIGDKYIDCVNK